MSGSVVATADRIVVQYPAGYQGVGRLVLGGLASRFELPVDRVEELLLALESLLLDGVAGGTVTLEAAAAPDGLRVRVGPFAGPRLGDASLARVMDKLVDEAREDGEQDAATWVELAVSASWLPARG